MFLNTRDMELRPLRFREEFPPGSIDYFDEKLRQKSVLQVEGKAELVQSLEEIRLTGRFQVDLEADCDRCLESLVVPVERTFELVYMPENPEAKGDEKGLSDEDAEVGFYSGAGLELVDVLREQVLLALPMQRLCREDCEGLCPVCGENWNVRKCDCEMAERDDRWTALRNLNILNKGSK
jgi:uncharacterized protein